jgi:hypothetical protein
VSSRRDCGRLCRISSGSARQQRTSTTRSCDSTVYARAGCKNCLSPAPLTRLESFADDKLNSLSRVLLWPLTEREELCLELFMSDIRPASGGPVRHTARLPYPILRDRHDSVCRAARSRRRSLSRILIFWVKLMTCELRNALRTRSNFLSLRNRPKRCGMGRRGA